MKKKIIICIFSLLISATAVASLVMAIDSYNYDMDPTNGVDLLEGMGAVFAALIGGVIVVYELDLFYTVYYFLIKPRTRTKSILNVLASLSFTLVFIHVSLVRVLLEHMGYMGLETYKLVPFETVPIILFVVYVLLRTAYLFVSCASVTGLDTANN